MVVALETVSQERERVRLLAASDWHLGTELCKAWVIDSLLARFEPNEIALVGDTFDSLDLRRLQRSHFDVLRRLSGQTKRGAQVHLIRGNHDEGFLKVVAAFIGADVRHEYEWEWNGRKVVFIHGDQFDTFANKYPWTTEFFTGVYWWLQFLLGSYADRICRFFKHNAKGYARAKKNVADGAIVYARLSKAKHVVCGHTHHAEDHVEDGIHYHNAGCGTEIPVSCITFTDTEIHRHYFNADGTEEEREVVFRMNI